MVEDDTLDQSIGENRAIRLQLADYMSKMKKKRRKKKYC